MYVLVDKDESYEDIMKASYIYQNKGESGIETKVFVSYEEQRAYR